MPMLLRRVPVRAALISLALLAGLLLLGHPGGAQVVAHSVSGRIVQEGDGTGVPGATVRLSGGLVRISGPEGEFRFARVPEGAHTLTVEAMGYRSRQLPLVVRSDTILLVELEVDPVRVDSILVRGRTVTVKGRVVDEVTGRPIPGAWIQTDLFSEVYSRDDGSFRLRRVPRGYPVTATIGAYRYLPRSRTFIAHRDTTLVIGMSPDSLAIRLFEVAEDQMQIRTRGVNLSQFPLTRDFIERRIFRTVPELIRLKTGGRPISEKCLFIDEVKQPFVEILDTYLPSEIERIEIFGRGAMVRIYTQDFVAKNLTRVDELPSIIYVMSGICY